MKKKDDNSKKNREKTEKAVKSTVKPKKKAPLKTTRKKAGTKPKSKTKGTGKGSNPNSLANLNGTKGIAGPGRTLGKRNFNTLVDLAIKNLAEIMVNTRNAEIKKNKKLTAKQKKDSYITIDDLDIESEIFMKLVQKARNGDQKAIDSFLDRRFGKAGQGKPGGEPETKAEAEAKRKEEAKKRATEMMKKWFPKK